MTQNDRASRLAAIRERLAKATPGPWRAIRSKHEPDDCMGIDGPNDEGIVETDSGCYPPRWPDADLIANAPTDLAFLLAERDALIAGLRALESQYLKDASDIVAYAGLPDGASLALDRVAADLAALLARHGAD